MYTVVPGRDLLDHPPMTTVVAMLALRTLLRHYLRRPRAPFLAVLAVPDVDNMFAYRDAAQVLIHGEMDPDNVGRSGDFVSIIYDLAESEGHVLRNKLSVGRRAVLLVSTTEGLPTHLSLAADLVGHLPLPTTAHFLAAARATGTKGMTSEDARFLCTQEFTKIELAFRKGRPVRSAMRRMYSEASETAATEARARAEAELAEKASKRKTLADMEGYGEVKEWGLQFAADIEDWRQGNVSWSDLDSGALISGPPGCGKTTFASALANSCGMELVVASAARWQAKGHLGDYLKAMHASFDLAKKKAPSILFLDEFDSFGDRDSDGEQENHDYKRQAINGLLECLDGADGREGVLVVGATNNPSVIDSALLRPGRLEVHLRIPLPDAAARVAILKQHLGTDEIDDDLSLFLSVSQGWTGAMIQKVAKSAKRLARRTKVPVDASLVAAALPKLREMSGLELKSAAAHEAGHALVGVLLKPCFLEQVIVKRQVVNGLTRQSLGRAAFAEYPGTLGTAQHYRARIAMLLGGIAAEQVLFGEYSDGAGGEANSDLALATDQATMMHRHMGLGNTLSMDLGKGQRPLEELRKGDPVLREHVEQTLREQFERAVDLLTEHREKLDRLTEMLVQQGRVDGDVVRALIDDGTSNLSRDVQ